MLRAALCALLVLAACHKDTDPPPMHPQEASDLPPLPPSSGTPVGYLVDNAGQLNLREDQMTKLKDIDRSLSARDEELETQIRLIEKPEDDPPPEKGAPPPRHNNAPGAQTKTTPESIKLHEERKANDDEALRKAFAVLDPPQQATARKLLEDRGVAAPGGNTKAPKRDADGAPVDH